MPCGKKRKRHKIATHKRKKRLRDMGGIIVVDFIDMRAAESRKKV